MKRRLLLLAALALLGLIFALLVNKLLYGQVKLTINGYHNPISTHVYINDKRVYPTGGGGRIYNLKTRPGSQKLKVTGPTIKKIEQTVSIKLLSSQASSVTTTELSARQSAASLIGEKTGLKISSAQAFGNDGWIVAETITSSRTADSPIYVFSFSYEAGVWQQVASGVKIDTDDKALEKAPQELVNYLAAVGGD